MSYNIMKKRAGFAGSTEGTIENIVDTHTNQTINGQKIITDLTASAFSSSATVYATAFVGDGSGLSGVGGGGGGAQGPVESIQFHTGSGGLSGSANLSFLTSSNTLEVTGDISASVNISASSFYGDGSNLTNLGAANISGQLSASQIFFNSPLSNSAGNLTVKTDTSRAIGSTANGIGLDTSTLTPQAGVNDSYYLITTDGSNNYNTIQFSVIESTLNIDGNNITGSINNAVLPATMSVTSITASSHVSASVFYGDGSGLTGVTGTPTPAGGNFEIQFNSGGTLGATSDLSFNTSSSPHKLEVIGQVSASSNILAGGYMSASSYATAGGTVIDSNGNFAGNNAYFNEITASSVISSSANISGAAFYGDGTTLSGVPLNTSVANGVVHVANAPSKTITTDSNFTYNGSDLVLVNGDFKINTSGDIHVINGNVTASGHVSASTYYGDGSGLTGIQTRTLVSYQSRIFLSNSTERFFCFAGSTTAQAAPSSDQQRAETTFIAPASGTLRQISITTFGASADNTSVVAACYKNGDYTSVITHTTGALEPGGGDGGRQLPILSNNFTNTFDMTSGSIGTPLAPGQGNVFVSGTVPFAFDPNDSLHFGFKFADGNNLIYGSINLLFELDSTDIP